MTLSLFTVGGTDEAGPTDPNQFPVQVAQGLMPSGWQIVADKLDGLASIPPVNWFPINYPAALYPMAPSVQSGRENLVAAIQVAPGPFVLCGYSQGAIVTDVVWSLDILATTGVIHDRLSDVTAIFNFGDPLRCFPPGTLVRMANGTERPIEEIRTGETVVTAESRIGRVVGTAVRDETRALATVKISGHRHLRCTVDHPILTKRGYVRADKLADDDWVAFTKYMPGTTSYVTVKDHVGPPHRLAKRLPEKIELDRDFGRLVGLYLAEGSRAEYVANLDFHANEEATLAADVIRIAKKYGIEARTRRQAGRPNSLRVSIGSIGWCRLLQSLCGSGASGKRMHADLTSGPADFLAAVLQGWLDGDGSFRRGSWSGTTISHELALNMYDIAQALGHNPTILTRHRMMKGQLRSRQWEVFLRVPEQHGDVDSFEKRWLNSRNRSGVPGVSYHRSYRGGKKWRASLQVDGRQIELGHYATAEEAAEVVRAKRKELGVTDKRGRTRVKAEDTHVWRRVESVAVESYAGPVYDITVEGDHSFVAEGVGVHNCPGIANGNLLAGIPLPQDLDGVVTGGIAGPADLTPQQTPDFLYSFALDGDLYACAPVGADPWKAEAPAGFVETSIYNVVQQATVIDVAAIAEDLAVPVGLVEAIINGLTFAAAGANAPHFRYGPYVPTVVAKIRQLAEQLTPQPQ